MSAHSTPGKAPKRLTLTPGPRPLHLGTGNALGSPLASAPLPRRMGSVAYGRDDMRLGFDDGVVRPGLSRGGSLRDHEGRRGRGHASTSSIGASEGVLERAQREAIERKRRSASALDDKDDRDQPPPVLTLTEKHKDLLHFIAQKEAKCVELRSQLATHEADLLQLKKKWEKIVAKGNDRQASRASAGNGAVDLVRGIFGLGEIALPPSPTQPIQSSPSPSYTSSPSPVKGNRPPLTPASRGHLSHTPHSSISTATSTRYSLSSVSSFAGVEQLKEKDEPRVVDAEDDDPDAWGPFETAEPEPIRLSGPAMSALGLSGVEKIGERRTSLANKRASSFMSDSFPSLSRQNSTPIRASPTPPMKLTSPRSKKPSVSPISTSHSTPAQRISSVSLIDDDDGTSATLGAVLQPSTSTTHNAQLASDAASVNTANDAFGEDWNW
ncbi:hypothetical protein RhiXN_08310 [Rhizoctonia solani]|uniref:Uncharacterized protein n=1 Tax=Rhizoctonia solani TaxID=456999 RepID=A0A8H7LFK4_9AGAM|nr:uncharacterized protein RhiXN_08310 [Rhizoctonia solani]KAF8675008.1 hypothetical protein RHS04_06998 [Rhizoctonia solani]QRW23274.1 hypothetical protein RhiXN_08310 [Rhizoctonia solani]